MLLLQLCDRRRPMNGTATDTSIPTTTTIAKQRGDSPSDFFLDFNFNLPQNGREGSSYSWEFVALNSSTTSISYKNLAAVPPALVPSALILAPGLATGLAMGLAAFSRV